MRASSVNSINAYMPAGFGAMKQEQCQSGKSCLGCPGTKVTAGSIQTWH